MENINNINLEQFRNPGSKVFSGRIQGKETREKLDLDRLDEEKGTIIIITIPKDTWSFNSSYFLGLFGPSIRKLGKEDFEQKFRFVCDNDEINEDIKQGIKDALNAG